MRFIKRGVALGVIFVLLLSAVLSMSYQICADAADNSLASYKQKIISVVYDNSGSMDAGNRIKYAKYSLQILLSLLGKDDLLVITPMNVSNGSPESISVKFGDGDRGQEISRIVNSNDIANANGGTPSAAIDKAVGQLRKNGMKTVAEAEGEDSDKEYWLVILTDGEFDGIGADASKLESEISKRITQYSNLRTIYLGISKSATDLTGCNLTKTAQFTAFKTDEKTFVEEMGKISNMISGKYELKQDSGLFKVENNKIILDLDKTDIPFRCISALVQNCAVTLRSISYNGSSLSPTQYSKIVGDAVINLNDGFSAVFEGTKAKPYISSGTVEMVFSGNLNGAQISLTGEPALSIEPYFEYLDNNSWASADVQFISSNLTIDNKIRMGYVVRELATGSVVDLDKVFGDVSSNIVYAGRNFGVGEAITLVKGVNEIAITVSVMNGAYTLNKSYICGIKENPTYYRVECEVEGPYNNNKDKVRLLYTIVDNNVKLSASQLSGYDWNISIKTSDGNEIYPKVGLESDGRVSAIVDLTGQKSKIFDWKINVISPTQDRWGNKGRVNAWYYSSLKVDATGDFTKISQYELLLNQSTQKGITFSLLADGVAQDFNAPEKINYSIVLNGVDISSDVTVSDGKLVYIPTLHNLKSGLGDPGKKILTVTVSSVANPAVTTKTDFEFELFASVLGAMSDPSSDAPFSISAFGLKTNNKKVCFNVTMDGNQVELDEGLFGWQMYIGSVDVTKHSNISGNIFEFVPTTASMGAEADSLGDKTIKLRVFLKSIPSVSAECSTVMTVEKINWKIEFLQDSNTTVDRFNINGSDAYIKFKILRDEKALSADELRLALEEDKILSVSSKTFDKYFWLPCGANVEVEDSDGEGVGVYRVRRNKFFIPFTSMLIFDGNKNVVVSIEDITADSSFFFPSSSWWHYTWRILVIILIIYLCFYIAGFFKCKRFPSGRYVKVTVNDKNAKAKVININQTFAKKYFWHLRRLLPWKLFINQPDNSVLTFSNNSNVDKSKGKRKSKSTVRKQEGPRLKLRAKKGNTIRRVTLNSGSAYSDRFDTFRSNLKKNSKASYREAASDFRGMFAFSGDDPIENPMLDGSSYYAVVDEKNVITEVRFFVRTR